MKKFMRKENICALLFLIIGIITVLEFVFVRGMFTWLLMVALVLVSGAVNVVLAVRNQDWIAAGLFALCSVALCMGYFALA